MPLRPVALYLFCPNCIHGVVCLAFERVYARAYRASISCFAPDVSLLLYFLVFREDGQDLIACQSIPRGRRGRQPHTCWCSYEWEHDIFCIVYTERRRLASFKHIEEPTLKEHNILHHCIQNTPFCIIQAVHHSSDKSTKRPLKGTCACERAAASASPAVAKRTIACQM
jgi:hypothetical protein